MTVFLTSYAPRASVPVVSWPSPASLPARQSGTASSCGSSGRPSEGTQFSGAMQEEALRCFSAGKDSSVVSAVRDPFI